MKKLAILLSFLVGMPLHGMLESPFVACCCAVTTLEMVRCMPKNEIYADECLLGGHESNRKEKNIGMCGLMKHREKDVLPYGIASLGTTCCAVGLLTTPYFMCALPCSYLGMQLDGYYANHVREKTYERGFRKR